MRHQITLLFTLLILTFTTTTISAQSNNSQSINQIELNLFPQPSTGVVNFLFNTVLTEQPTIRVYDLLGNKIYENDANRLTTNVYSVNLEGFKPGYYFVKVIANNQTWSRRITIKL